ncbi:MAG: GNAT family N-acetyltransferase [Candidatus Dormibacteria bacterium]
MDAPPAGELQGALRAELRVEVSATGEDFVRLKDEWVALETRAAEDNIFLTWTWQHAWWQELGAGRRLDLLTFHAGERLVGVAPTFWDDQDGAAVVRFGGGLEVTDYLGFIVEEGFEDAVGRAFMRHFKESCEATLDLHFLRSDGVTLAALRTAATALGMDAVEEEEEVSPRISLGGDWEAYLGGLGKKDRHELRRKRRRLEDAGGWIVRETRPEALGNDLEVFFQLHEKSSRAKSDFLTPEMKAFFRHAAHDLQREGWLSLRTLDYAGVPVAAVLGFVYRGRLLLYNSGYDPEYNRLSCGFVMMTEEVRLAIEAGLTEVDFLRGNERYKYELGARDLPLVHLRVRTG